MGNERPWRAGLIADEQAEAPLETVFIYINTGPDHLLGITHMQALDWTLGI